MSCLWKRCWYFREHLVRPLGPALAQLDAGTAKAGASWVVSVAHVSAPNRNSGAAPAGLLQGANPAMSLICVTDFCGLNSTATRLADGAQSGSKQRKQTQIVNDSERLEQQEHYRQEEKFISSKHGALPRERKCSSHHFSLSTTLQKARLKKIKNVIKAYLVNMWELRGQA